VVDIDGQGEVSAGGDELAVAASVFKVAVALEVFTQAAAGRLDPRERVRVSPGRATPGPTGLSVFADEAEMSVRDLALMMMTISDNAATDILIDLAGLDAIRATLGSLGLRATVIPGRERDELDSIGQDSGFAGWDDMIRASAEFTAKDDRRIQENFLRARALSPEHAIRTTAKVTRQRLAVGFPHSGTQIAAKSGSLLGIIRSEIGVITMPDGHRYAAAVFTRANRPYDNEHEINTVIGIAAARAVEHLSRR
jgi:beta-lactamase class A